MASKTLYREPENAKIAGVCAGFATYFGLDMTAVRLLTTAFIILSGVIPGLLLYVIAWAVMSVRKASKA